MNEGEGSPLRPWIEGRPRSAPIEDRIKWFSAHYGAAADQILRFIEDAGLSIDTRRVLDIGCGDGAIDLGVCSKASPARLLGLDLIQTDVDDLRAVANAAGVNEWPRSLEFGTCTSTAIPLPDCSIDAVISWSVFEHVANPIRVLCELRRVIRPGGFMFLQIWPLYLSQHGSHLWFWYPAGWEHHLREPGELVAEVRKDVTQPRPVVDEMLTDFTTLNRLTMADLQRALSATGFRIRRLELQTDTIEVPKDLMHLSVLDLATSGVKLIAVPD
jgi:ubiquinone/menaquinone biosynthesis C-methylase UbiE